MTIALALIGLFGVLRAIAPSAWLVILLTWPVGIGMGLGNALAPLVVRETVPERPATGTGVYTTGIQLGSTVAAALAVPIAAVLGGWRGALIAFSLGACVVAVAWVVLERGGAPHERPHAPRPAPPVALAHGLAAGGDLRLHGLGVLRPERLAARTPTASVAGATSRRASSSPG